MTQAMLYIARTTRDLNFAFSCCIDLTAKLGAHGIRAFQSMGRPVTII